MSQVRPMIRNLAGYVTQLAQETNSHLNALNRQVEAMQKVLAALIRVVGEEEVQGAIKALEAEQRKALEEQQDIAVKKLVDGGALVAALEVGTDSLVVGTDTYAKTGEVRKVRFEMEALPPEAAAKFLGKKVGDTVVNEEAGVTFTLTEVYSIDKEKVQEILAPKAPAVATNADGQPFVATGADNAQEDEEAPAPAPAPTKKSGKKTRKARA